MKLNFVQLNFTEINDRDATLNFGYCSERRRAGDKIGSRLETALKVSVSGDRGKCRFTTNRLIVRSKWALERLLRMHVFPSHSCGYLEHRRFSETRVFILEKYPHRLLVTRPLLFFSSPLQSRQPERQASRGIAMGVVQSFVFIPFPFLLFIFLPP